MARRAPAQRKKSAPTAAETLAERCARQVRLLDAAGRSLHDDAGPLLSAAGLHLQLLQMDAPQCVGQIREVTALLDQALDKIRTLSSELNSSPVFRGGLRTALEGFVAGQPFPVILRYDAPRPVPPEVAASLYEAVTAAILAAHWAKATVINVTVRASAGSITVRISDNGRSSGRIRALAAPQFLAAAQGLKFTIATLKSTIVSIRVYAARRSASG